MNIFSILAGLAFGIWPFFMKKSGLTPMANAVVLTVVSLMVYLPFVILNPADLQAVNVLTVGFGLAVVAGAMNGLGTIAFQKMVTNKEVAIATGVMLVILTQVVVTAVGERVLYGDLFTTKKVFGIAAAGAAVYLLTSK